MVLETAAIVSAATPLVKSLVEKLVTPKLQGFTTKLKNKYNEIMIPQAEHFQEYLERSYEKYSTINTLVFHNSQRQLKDIYVAQTLMKENVFDENKGTVTIDKLPVALIKEFSKLLITDTAGMGKSTIMKRMFIDLIDNGLTEVGIPIYIELNKLNRDHTILTEIQEELSSLSEKFDNELLLKFIQTGGFIFFLDGYDEISIMDRNEVTIDIHTFISKAGNNNYYILTSRPENGLASFGDFQSFKIQPLKKEEAFELLTKYDLSKKKELSERLIELLNSGQYDAIDEYLNNPLLVSLLYTAYDYNRSIPFEKHRFYGVVFDAYFEKHDSSKPIKSRDKLSGLNHDGFDSILRYVGYKCLTSVGVQFNEDTILNTIREARGFSGNLDFAESDFLKDLVSSVPLFCKEGAYYKWVHKSLLEYFAARFVFCDAKQKQDDILKAFFNSEHVEKYINMLDLYYDIDNFGFVKNIEFPLLQKYISFYKENCFKSAVIENKLIEERISHMFARTIFVDTTIPKNVFSEKFEDLSNRVEQKFNVTLDSASFTSSGLMFGFKTDPSRRLYYLLAKRNKNLFIEKERNGRKREKIKTSISLSILDSHTCKNNRELYKTINDSLMLGVSGLETNFRFLSYEECCKEVKRIDVLIKKNEETLSLLEGL